MFLKRLFSKDEAEIKKLKDELGIREYKIESYKKLIADKNDRLCNYAEEIGIARHEITGLRILLDHKDAEIEDLKEQIRWGDES